MPGFLDGTKQPVINSTLLCNFPKAGLPSKLPKVIVHNIIGDLLRLGLIVVCNSKREEKPLHRAGQFLRQLNYQTTIYTERTT